MPENVCATDCTGGGGGYKYVSSGTSSNGANATTKYNDYTSILGTASQSSGQLFTSTHSTTSNADGSATVNAKYQFSSGSSLSATCSLPAGSPSSFNLQDSNGVFHSVAITTSGSTTTAIDTLSYHGNTGYVKVIDGGSGTASISYSLPSVSGSFSATWPTASTSYAPRITADAAMIHNDFASPIQAQELAIRCSIRDFEGDSVTILGLVLGAIGFGFDITGVGVPAGVIFGGAGIIVGSAGFAIGHSACS